MDQLSLWAFGPPFSQIETVGPPGCAKGRVETLSRPPYLGTQNQHKWNTTKLRPWSHLGR